MWVLLSLYFAFWTSVSTLIMKNLTRRVDSILITVPVNIFIIPLMYVVITFEYENRAVSSKFYSFMIYSGILDTIAFATAMRAIKISPLSLIAPMSSFNPVFTTIIAWLFLHESPNPLKFSGIFTILLAALFLKEVHIKERLLGASVMFTGTLLLVI